VLILKTSIFLDITPYSPLKVNVSWVHVASIFAVEEEEKQETSIMIKSRNMRWEGHVTRMGKNA
jgi:hypothetical protein